MNEIDPRLRYTPESVRAYQIGDELIVKDGQLNSLAAHRRRIQQGYGVALDGHRAAAAR